MPEQEEDKCPKCGHRELEKEDYIDDIVDNDTIARNYQCPECGFDGKIIYNLEFEEHLTEDGKEIS